MNPYGILQRKQETVVGDIPGYMPLARRQAKLGTAKRVPEEAVTCPLEGVELSQHNRRGGGTAKIDAALQPRFDRTRHQFHGKGIDEEGLKDDVEIGKQCDRLVARRATLINYCVASRLKRLHNSEVSERQPNCPGLPARRNYTGCHGPNANHRDRCGRAPTHGF